MISVRACVRSCTFVCMRVLHFHERERENVRERDFIINLTYFVWVRKTEEEMPRYIAKRDELFDIILEAHISMGHGGEKKGPREFWMENKATLQAKWSVISFRIATHANGRNQSQIRVAS